MKTLAVLLFLAAPAFGEYLPGFTLYGHVGDAESVVLARVDSKGRATVLELIRGKPIPGGALTIDPKHLRLDEAFEGRRAILFLAGGQLVGLEQSGVAWIRDDRVELLPDNWGWGIWYPAEYQAPSVARFKKSVEIVARKVEEVRRIGEMKPGEDRAFAVCRVLCAAAGEPELAWYVFFGDSLGCYLELTNRRSAEEYGFGHVRTFVEEVRTALDAAIDDWSAEEREALLAALRVLPPGTVRREHIEILLRAGVTHADGAELLRWFRETTEVREKVALARAVLAADPGTGRRVLHVYVELVGLKQPELVSRLLVLLGTGKRSPALRLTARRLTRQLLAAGGDPDTGGRLGRALVGIVSANRDEQDRPLLLKLARSKLICRNQALSNLRSWTGKDWEADDGRWDRLLAE